MACIENEEENTFIANLVAGELAWIGGTKLRDGSWIWMDGTKWDFENWRRGEPSNSNNINLQGKIVIGEDSLGINWDRIASGYGKWNDFPNENNFNVIGHAYNLLGFVCQYYI